VGVQVGECAYVCVCGGGGALVELRFCHLGTHHGTEQL
jgi:hypothetical protein